MREKFKKKLMLLEKLITDIYTHFHEYDPSDQPIKKEELKTLYEIKSDVVEYYQLKEREVKHQ